MEIVTLAEIQRTLNYGDVIGRMRDALLAYSAGECDTPMPMHLDIPSEEAEVHMKSSYRRGGKYFVLKVASTFPGNTARGMSTGNGMMLLCSARTGKPLAVLADEGHLTDVRTAAVASMAARELGRRDETLGIIGAGIQARLQARMHAEVLPLRRVVVWARSPERARNCASDIEASIRGVEATTAPTPAEVARQARLIITATASRRPLLFASDLQGDSHISAVGADSPGKQELDPEVLRRADFLLVDSLRQCQKLGELQHCPGEVGRALEIGAMHSWRGVSGSSVCDFTGLGVEDLYIAEYCYENR